MWINDPEKRRVVVGPYGFAWWRGSRVFIGVFEERSDQPLVSFNAFVNWDGVKAYDVAKCPTSTVLRFVRTGLLP